uniref:Acyl_transf_3 domain-containing protein n=2 Tax=Caenorhabditis tropicalis TaxID=1561998 RepID=A0A1I7TQS3_9PELO
MPFELSYSFLPARIWQFLLGSVAFELSRGGHEADKTKKKENNLDSFSYLLIGILGTVVSLPWLFGEHSTRFQPLVFIGDISYVTYLIHWPIINFVRYVQLKDDSILSIYEALVTIIIIFVLSILVLYCLEKPILQSNFSTNCVITVVFIGSCVSFIPWIRNQECLAMKTLPLSVRGKLEFNSNFSNIMSPISELGCEYNETTAGLVINIESVEYCSRKGNGTGRILVIGNSVSIRAFPQIFHIFNGNYEEIRLFAKHGGAPLLNVFPYYTQAAVDMAREMNPDLIWIIQGINEVLSRDPNSPISTDEVVQNTMDQFKGLAKMVYVDLPYFITDKIPVNLIPRIFLYRKSLKEHLSVSLSEVEEQIKGHTDRPLIYDGIHLGFAAFERINPIYEKRIDQFYKVLKSERNN